MFWEATQLKLKLIKDKAFYLSLAALALPIALQDLIKYGLNLADNVMVGALSEIELSAVTLANQPFFLFSMLSFGLASGGAVLIAQYYGKQNIDAINRVISITLGITLGFTVVIGSSVLLFPEFYMRLFTNEEPVIQVGVEYLKIVGWTYFLFGMTNTLVLILRSIQVVRPSLIFNVLSFCINLFLNWVLIFGKLGAPALGVQGAAFATLIARFIECMCMVLYIRFKEKRIQFRFKNLVHFDKNLLRDFIKYSTPVAVNEVVWGLAVTMISVVFGHLGSDAVSAASVTTSVQQVISVWLLGTANASCILIGKQIGEGNRDYAIRCSRTLLVIALGLGVVIGAIVWFLREPVLSFYNLQPSTKELAKTLMGIAAGLVIVDSLGLTSIVGIMRGGGDTRFAMFADVSTQWLFAVPLGLILGLVLHVDVPWVYLALRSDILIRFLICLPRIKNNKWVHDVTRTEELAQP